MSASTQDLSIAIRVMCSTLAGSEVGELDAIALALAMCARDQGMHPDALEEGMWHAMGQVYGPEVG